MMYNRAFYTTAIRMSKRRDEPKVVNVTAFISAQISGIFFAEENNIILHNTPLQLYNRIVLRGTPTSLYMCHIIMLAFKYTNAF